MKIIRYTLLADGTSDEVLIPIIDWLISDNYPDISFQSNFAKDIGKVGMSLEARIPAALKYFPCDILFVHRDGEGQILASRLAEINAVCQAIDVCYVPVIPVRMTEAWLLSDESAIRSAAGNIAGRVNLKLPNRKSWETLADPKELLFDALVIASEKTGRALKKFNPAKERAFVARRTASFEALRGLSSFDLFEMSLKQQFERIIPNALD